MARRAPACALVLLLCVQISLPQGVENDPAAAGAAAGGDAATAAAGHPAQGAAAHGAAEEAQPGAGAGLGAGNPTAPR